MLLSHSLTQKQISFTKYIYNRERNYWRYSNLDPNKATGPDKISNKMLNISPEKIATSLLIIFNISLQQSKYPSNLIGRSLMLLQF